MAVVAGAGDLLVHLGFGIDGLGQTALGALVQHRDDVTDDLEVAQFLGGDVEQHVFTAWIVFRYGLGEVTHGGSELALWATELFQHQVGQTRVRSRDADRILQALVMCKHSDSFDR